MMSLRRRIVLGSLLWTAGMIVVASALFSVLMEALPHARLAVTAHVHGTLQAPLVLFVAVLCLVTGALQVRHGLRRIDDLRTDLARMHQGDERQLNGAYPTEVQPLADEINALLERRDDAVRNALGKAGDLAHGLKTPLAVLARDDDGPGVAEGLRTAVLRRGVRADEATPGTGLGLAIVRNLADAYGGSIDLEASPAEGCRAVLRLSSAESAFPRQPQTSSSRLSRPQFQR